MVNVPVDDFAKKFIFQQPNILCQRALNSRAKRFANETGWMRFLIYLRFFQKSYPTSAKMSSKRVGKTAADSEATAVPEEVQDTGLNPAVAERSSPHEGASPVKDAAAAAEPTAKKSSQRGAKTQDPVPGPKEEAAPATLTKMSADKAIRPRQPIVGVRMLMMRSRERSGPYAQEQDDHCPVQE